MMNRKLNTWSFEVDNDKQVELVLSGFKNTRVSLYDEKNESHISDEEVLIFDNEKQACTTRVTNVLVTEFRNLDNELKEECVNNMHYDVSDDTMVQVITFEVINNLVEERLNIAWEIVNTNKDIFGSNPQVSEINAGFNNSIFNVLLGLG